MVGVLGESCYRLNNIRIIGAPLSFWERIFTTKSEFLHVGRLACITYDRSNLKRKGIHLMNGYFVMRKKQ